MKKFGFLVIALALLVVGMAMADVGVNQTPETQGITTQTVVYALGTTTENDNIVWQQSSAVLNAPPLTPTERQYTMSYTENSILDQGYGEYTKQMNLDTQSKVANQFNFQATKQVDYVTDATVGLGRITSSEDLLLDGAGNGSSTNNMFICPFATQVADTIPPYCNVVEMGSSFDGTAVSMATSANERHVIATADPGVAMNYDISAAGVGTAAAWINAHIMEGRAYDANTANKAIDLTYSEKTTSSGVIQNFAKDMSYVSSWRLPYSGTLQHDPRDDGYPMDDACLRSCRDQAVKPEMAGIEGHPAQRRIPRGIREDAGIGELHGDWFEKRGD